jgi:hypothetical protein
MIDPQKYHQLLMQGLPAQAAWTQAGGDDMTMQTPGMGALPSPNTGAQSDAQTGGNQTAPAAPDFSALSKFGNSLLQQQQEKQRQQQANLLQMAQAYGAQNGGTNVPAGLLGRGQ